MNEAQIRADEREKIARDLECEADLLPCAEDAAVTRANAALIRAKMSYAVAFDGETEEIESKDRNDVRHYSRCEEGQRHFDIGARGSSAIKAPLVDF